MQTKTDSYKIHPLLIEVILNAGYSCIQLNTEKNRLEQEKTEGYLYYHFVKDSNRSDQMISDGYKHGLFIIDDGSLQYKQTVFYGFYKNGSFVPVKKVIGAKHLKSVQVNSSAMKTALHALESNSYTRLFEVKISVDEDTTARIWKSKYRQAMTATRTKVLDKALITEILESDRYLIAANTLISVMLLGAHPFTKPVRHARKWLDLFSILCEKLEAI